MTQKLKPGELLPDEVMRFIQISQLSIYEVITNSDLTEGRGARVSLGYFLQKSDACEKAKGAGVFGCDAEVSPAFKWCLSYSVWIKTDRVRQMVCVLGEEVMLEYTDPNVLRKRALAKLSAEDLEILGLTDK